MVHWTRIVAVVLLAGVVGGGGGCLAVAAGVATGATVLYLESDLTATMDAPPRIVVAASERALDDMGISVLNAASTDVDGSVTARTAQDRKVAIIVARETTVTSRVSIRVGTMGDEAASRRIYEKIRDELAR